MSVNRKSTSITKVLSLTLIKITMKKRLLSFLCCALLALSVLAQDTLKVNFKPSGTIGDPTWDSILVADKAEFNQASTFNKFGNVVLVKPVWKTTTIDNNYRSIDRNNNDFQYTGKYSEVFRSFIAADIRQENDCDAIGVEISNLPEGSYTFVSYHHDFIDQHGVFAATTSVGGTVVDEDATRELMVSHSMDTAQYNDRYPVAEYADAQFTSPEMAEQFQETYVTNTLDSITSYKFEDIVITGPTDIVLVLFKSPSGNDPDVSHNRKLIVLNGFQLYKNPESVTEKINIASNTVSVYPNPASEVLRVGFQSEDIDNVSFSIIDITGKTLLRNTSQVVSKRMDVDISSLQKGTYFIKVSQKEDQIVKKFVIM
jgi:hypothetical protein